MIILAIGMPRAGSGWHYNFIKELMDTTGCDDARVIRERFHLQSILTEVNCNIGVLSLRRLALVSIPALLGHTFVIKAHSGPTPWLRFLVRIGMIKPLYIYRDPRDAMLSAQDYGARVLEKQGRPNAFSHLTSFSLAQEFFSPYITDWQNWRQVKGLHLTRYEDFLTNYNEEAAKIVRFLGLSAADPKIIEIIEKNKPAGSVQGKQGTHFFKGLIGRYKDAYSADELNDLWAEFGVILTKMGYSE